MDKPAQWATERVNKLYGDSLLGDSWRDLFARYIEAHEQPPVDPDLVTAREICALVVKNNGYYNAACRYREGVNDADAEVQFALAKLKEARGK